MRTRFAPSPTGFVTVGNLLQPVIDLALARQHGGQFVLRIEDTDQERFVPEAEAVILDTLRWLGLEWDEGPDKGGPYGPYRQSARQERYREVAEALLGAGRAYHCWCSPARLEAMREEQRARKQPPMYDRLCLGKSEAERKRLGGCTERAAVRLLMPREGHTTIVDAIRGPITFRNALSDDRVLVRSNGLATYQLAAVVDDHDMAISHVIRGEEWISSTPVNLQVYEAMGWEVPTIAHTPLLLNADRSKISKSKHPWVHVSWFREQGFLPEAMVNYIGNLVVFVPDPESSDPSVARELFGMAEVTEHLDLARIGPAGKLLDLDRLDWLNGQYIRRLSLPELRERLRQFMARAGLDVDDPQFVRALPLEQERIKRLAEAPSLFAFFFHDPAYEAQQLIPRGADAPRALELLRASLGLVRAMGGEQGAWTAQELERAFRALAERLGLASGRERGQLIGAGVVRVAVTGRTVGPPLFETLEILGRDTVQRRLEVALTKLSS
ncbi:MAG TPA: glutamate--tRNA ligase [Chloroflexota bacterium]|nr:glutamate--tRNA ligase [Chloroflexota bacterium]